MKNILFALLLLSIVPACVHTPPPGTYSSTGTRAYQADQLLKDITALSQTAINLNQTSGSLHLSDTDTRYVRDFALSSGAALNSYATGTSVRAQVKVALDDLEHNLSSDASVNQTLKTALAIVARGIAGLPD